MTRKTNFDRYLDEKLKDPEFARGFDEAGKAWDVALQLAELRRKEGLTQGELARRVGTTQQQISRLESPEYRGHSMRELERVASALGATVQVRIRKANSVPAATKRSRTVRTK